MIKYLKLFYDFIIVGAFSFGGAYSAIPLVKDVADKYSVLSNEAIADFIAISESTPGSIGVNLATFIGTTLYNLPGAIIATFAEVLPAFLIMLVVSIYFSKVLQNEKVKFVLSVIRPCIIGIIMSVGIYMIIEILNDNVYSYHIDFKSLVVFICILLIVIAYKISLKKSLGAISIIIIGAFFGIAINTFM